ncbi:MAG: right-handed parallel beta-helix repeat-containing protein, partial [Kordia sp.]|uniref:right-handed parallel beta-helix repeat-containing protein n=1 Tax=Kordia sp. TaxID=1965332 RepID=UPI00385FF7D8
MKITYFLYVIVFTSLSANATSFKDFVDIRATGANLSNEDNSLAIERALTIAFKRNIRCYIPSGTWRIKQPINIQRALRNSELTKEELFKNSLFIYGESSLSIIQNNGTDATFIFKNSYAQANDNLIKINQFTFDGITILGNQNSTDGIHFTGFAQNFLFENITVSKNGGHGIYLENCNHIYLKNIKASFNGFKGIPEKYHAGLYIKNANNVSISHLKTTSNYDGLSINNCRGVSVTGATIENNYRHGIHVLGVKGAALFGNYIVNNNTSAQNMFGHGIYIDTSIDTKENFTSGIVCSGNFISAGAQKLLYAIYIKEGRFIKITGNHFEYYTAETPIFVSAFCDQ